METIQMRETLNKVEEKGNQRDEKKWKKRLNENLEKEERIEEEENKRRKR